jgi:hypothetical protein
MNDVFPMPYTDEELDYYEQQDKVYQAAEARKQAVYVPARVRSDVEDTLILMDFSPVERARLTATRAAVAAGYYTR